MANIFFASDHHFGHANTFAKFKLADGCTPLRPFTSIEEMNQAMIDRHNAVVQPHDKVYFLGDVVINKKYLEILKQLNGHKRLVRGNHDIEDTKMFMQYFEQIYGCRVFVGDFICTHIPIHVDSLARFRTNLHGHLHGNRVMMQSQVPELRHTQVIDPRYFSVCVEQINYTPMSMDELRVAIKKQKDEAGYIDPHYEGAVM